jgi:hypothetical protein
MSFDFIDRKFAHKPKCEPAQPDTSRWWWCDKCNDHIDGIHVTFEGRHTACGAEVDEYCEDCENGGWVQVYSQHPPDFRECEKCYNPRGYRSP